ncbi:hypothetical protein Q5424_16460 [Conexibacter sp. JD483]|uniref:hypothetical protein n=1 Tax=unclassified Conexibacter TaxID=2627773 RepID=UPI002722DEC6|nr:MULTISPECIES: hypothetical protein [unclassified Conexibacter]MDO8188565.1 hypothetical protein [Conexibacter sp. CPCC 205706]MDO8199948.1 hypothetical protein [Conexibacter sp. CPCC 205762]MDR9370692.1 hypothetical protein [Conexibacter sp. JD483]
MGQELLGMALASVAACCYEGGYALQAIEARAVERHHALRLSLAGQLARRRRWLAGTALSLAGYPLQVAALTLAPLALVQPVLALGLLLLLAFGRLYLHEAVGRREVVATGLIVAGVAAIAIAAPQRSDQPMHGAALLLLAAALVAAVAAPWVQQALRRAVAPWSLVVAAGAGDAFAAIAAALVAARLLDDALALAALWALAAAAAAAAGFLAEMSALRRLPATRIGPPVLVLQVVVPVLAGRISGGEQWGSRAPLVWLGLALVAGGVALLAASRTVAALRT